ncbi:MULTISPECIES: hypothetical protein [unclassified Micromonospora]|uniref:hypothetical protein n=1 Tax=unclassified Micromonospora TaxID=2617518 RepID=UPI0022B71112|nr:MULTISPECIES: hypothetical protein [unclassified Micromonospora]MCZ7421956.1 hypothetical protein [Verrucosispora sp. WMMA2121]WBB93310.1 hypothetical protein O7597_10190 [Verrucosispora sp. WMMC514]
MIVAIIVACEIGFWAILAAGLFARYVLRLKRLGGFLLFCVPVTDLILITASVIDLRNGSPIDATHGLAALYLGFSVAFGPDLVRRADGWFVHRFAGGPRPVKPPKYGAARVRYEWRAWLRCFLAWIITCAVTALLAVVSGHGLDDLVTGLRALTSGGQPPNLAIYGYTVQATVVTLVWFIGWPLRMTFSPPRPPSTSDAPELVPDRRRR